ncbi:MAG: leucine-rich repeat protein [Oscillospiraceae bacterium]|nr:leucine-rich repeat protein [Oscillospiraceae bacterium]
MKRIISLFLVVILWLNIPLPAFAADKNIVDQGSCGRSAQYTLYEDGHLSITGTGRIDDYSFYDWNRHYGKEITSLEIADTITEIGPFAFGNCYSLANIDFPAELKLIDYGAFSECKALETVIIPDGVTEIGHSVFDTCSNLSKLVIPASVTTITGRPLYACNSLKTAGPIGSGCNYEFGWTVDIPPYAFAGLHSVTEITLPDTVETIGEYAFESCEMLDTVILPENLKILGNAAFMCCYGLKEITIPEKITELERTFKYCTALETIAVPDSVTYMRYTFSDCESLKNVKLSKNLKSIGPNSFDSCMSLENIEIPQATNLIEEGAFKNCFNLKTIHLPNSVKRIFDLAFDGCTSITNVYYGGSPAQWDNMAVENYNENLLNAQIQYKLPDAPDNNNAVERIKGKDRYATSFEIANKTKEQMGVDKFSTVIIASGEKFADALSGSYLAKIKNAPILMTNGKDSNISDIKNYILANLTDDGTVYILGGTAAVNQHIEDTLKSIPRANVKRLKGKTRYDTNIEILKESGVTNQDILVATGTNFADSLSASAAGKPILLVDGQKSLTQSQKDYLNSLDTGNLYILGGTGAVGENYESELAVYGNVERIKGANRHETSVAIAEKFFTNPKSALIADAWNFPDGLCGGPLAISMNCPLILTKSGDYDAAKYFMAVNGISDGAVLGGIARINDETAKDVFGVNKILKK